MADITKSMQVKKPTILVDCLRISGFRGIQNFEMTFAPMTVLIGPNNSGKTTVLKAFGLALGDYSRYLSEEDFYIATDSNGGASKAKEIIIDIRIVPLTDNGQRANTFEQSWQAEFGDKIKAEADGKQYVAVRSKVYPNIIQSGFSIDKFTMEKWPNFGSWLTENVKLTRIPLKFESIAFFSIEAQRDIHQELKDKSSFVGKVLSSIEYDKTVTISLEKMIDDLNKEAVEKSEELQHLKDHLTQLNQTFQGAGNAEITPFPKKIRDLSKNFSVHFGETAKNSFSMEYHGMGTRSWASMLSVRALMDTLRIKYEKEVKPYFPILAAEEPEAHLHPNAQKTLFYQLDEVNAQVVVSTHSPYFTAMSDMNNVRSLRKTSQGIVAASLQYIIPVNEKKILTREILARRGELLFSRALILCEGMTEEQVIPAMFEIFSGGYSLFDFGISCISVGGNNYVPFIKLACSLGIPTFIVSDNDGNTQTEVTSQIEKLKSEFNLSLGSDVFGIAYCQTSNDFEAELLNVLKLRDEINEALVLFETNATLNPNYRFAKENEITKLTDADILKEMREAKTSYAGHLADVIRQNIKNKQNDQLITQAVNDAFTAIKGWLQI